jgi:hypothetical protein
MKYLKLDAPILLEKKVPILLFSNFLSPSPEEKTEIYDKILKYKDIWKNENNWISYFDSFGVPEKLFYQIESNVFFDDLYSKFIITFEKYLNKFGYQLNNRVFNVRCLNTFDPHYMWNSVSKENTNSIIAVYCFCSADTNEFSTELDFEYNGKFFSYMMKENDLLIFPNIVDYALKPPLSKKYQVFVNFGVNTSSNFKKIFSNYI